MWLSQRLDARTVVEIPHLVIDGLVVIVHAKCWEYASHPNNAVVIASKQTASSFVEISTCDVHLIIALRIEKGENQLSSNRAPYRTFGILRYCYHVTKDSVVQYCHHRNTVGILYGVIQDLWIDPENLMSLPKTHHPVSGFVYLKNPHFQNENTY